MFTNPRTRDPSTGETPHDRLLCPACFRDRPECDTGRNGCGSSGYDCTRQTPRRLGRAACGWHTITSPSYFVRETAIG